METYEPARRYPVNHFRRAFERLLAEQTTGPESRVESIEQAIARTRRG